MLQVCDGFGGKTDPTTVYRVNAQLLEMTTQTDSKHTDEVDVVARCLSAVYHVSQHVSKHMHSPLQAITYTSTIPLVGSDEEHELTRFPQAYLMS